MLTCVSRGFQNAPISMKFMNNELHPFLSLSLWNAPLGLTQKWTMKSMICVWDVKKLPNKMIPISLNDRMNICELSDTGVLLHLGSNILHLLGNRNFRKWHFLFNDEIFPPSNKGPIRILKCDGLPIIKCVCPYNGNTMKGSTSSCDPTGASILW